MMDVALAALIAFPLGVIIGAYFTIHWNKEVFFGSFESILDEQGYEIVDGQIKPREGVRGPTFVDKRFAHSQSQKIGTGYSDD